MRVSSALVVLATLGLASAKKINMHCEFAADRTGMIQQPYCCRDMKPAEHNAKANEAQDCDQLQQPQLCEDQSRPACCYQIGPKKICTSHVIFQDAADV
ncbi:uncharacterized protein N7459_007482 [Penicillium hispanicum]|uniref:uncharacterized protein n=1 Tax=Penicillium hispanicum TaxID=1080232 RepID=UPI002541CBFE|nr:uncharacterized protein N7459_007482 [Penicillium hispanicum]KAJ5578518.1 hypothetical protein N7459_007482 [Penicillium hispanicum]